MRQLDAGPHKVNEALAAYLRAERDLGRVRADVDVDTAADLLLGVCFQQAFLSHFHGVRPEPRPSVALLCSAMSSEPCTDTRHAPRRSPTETTSEAMSQRRRRT